MVEITSRREGNIISIQAGDMGVDIVEDAKPEQVAIAAQHLLERAAGFKHLDILKAFIAEISVDG